MSHNAHPTPKPGLIEWVPTTPAAARSLSLKALVAGRETDGSPLWVIRAHHSSGELIPGKLNNKHQYAYISYSGEEVPVSKFELLCVPPQAVRWVPSRDGQVPAGAVQGGKTKLGEPLYIGRATFLHSITPGKVHPSHGCMYVSFDGKEVPHKVYEVLCRVGV